MKFKQLIEQREVKESYDDYHGDMSKDDYDKSVKSSEMEYTVWVGGTEVNDTWLSYDDAVRLYDKYKAQGYDDVQLDARIKESVNEGTDGCDDCDWISKETDGDIDTCDECAAEKREKTNEDDIERLSYYEGNQA